ncbi:hypothetical protein D3C83_23280 [compost metagenome]
MRKFVSHVRSEKRIIRTCGVINAHAEALRVRVLQLNAIPSDHCVRDGAPSDVCASACRQFCKADQEYLRVEAEAPGAQNGRRAKPGSVVLALKNDVLDVWWFYETLTQCLDGYSREFV